MLYSQQIVRRYCSINKDAELIANELIIKTCEVEELIQRTIPQWVVIGKVMRVEEHPNADKLVICQLDCWNKWTYQICTWATNMVVWTYVPVALPSTHLPAIWITIEPRKMRGEDSNWMICSKEELWIADDLWYHSIRVLQNNTYRWSPWYQDDLTAWSFDDITDKDLWISLLDKYPRLENRVMDVENKTITHRPDMFGHFWLAFELQALFPDAILFNSLQKIQEKMRPWHIIQLLSHAEKHTIPVTISAHGVYTYCSIDISAITIAPSDFYNKLQLIDCWYGIKNNWVDFSNIFMLITGQPVHFFDKKKIQWGITVRNAQPWEEFTDLFEKKHTLESSDIVIADDQKILALAWIIWSNSAWISDETTDIVVEIANFDPIIIRKTAMRLWLRTEAQVRFEKSINPLYTLATVELFLDELSYAKKSLWSYTINGIETYINEENNTHVIEQIDIDWKRIFTMLYGTENYDTSFKTTATNILQHLWYQVFDNTINVPIRRAPEDITNEADLLEDIGRIIWFNTIPALSRKETMHIIPQSKETKQKRILEDLLVNKYKALQVETYPRLNKKRITSKLSSAERLFRLKNPLQYQQNYLRDTMIWSLLELTEKNAAFFESFLCYEQGKVRNKHREHYEHDMLGICIYTKATTPLDHPVRTLKEIIVDILQKLDIQHTPIYTSTNHDMFHPKQQAEIYLDTVHIWSIQTIHPSLLTEHKIDENATVSIAELDYTLLKDLWKQKTQRSYHTLQDQLIKRDLNFLIEKEQPYSIITDALSSVDEITNIQLFDLYMGTNIPAWKKSCALTITIPWTWWLTTEQINTIMEKAINAVQAAWWTLRS